MNGLVSHAELLARPLPDDLGEAHAMIQELRSLLDEHRASFGDVDDRQVARRVAHLRAGIMQCADWRGPQGRRLAAEFRRRAGRIDVPGGARLLLFLADAAPAQGTGRVIGYEALCEAVRGPARRLEEMDTRQAERSRVKVAAFAARMMLDLNMPDISRADLMTVYDTGLCLHARAARWVRELERLGARSVAGQAVAA